MQIEVIHRDYSTELVDDSVLDRMIDAGEIIAFRRSSGLVLIGMDPIRRGLSNYTGPERRNSRLMLNA